MFRKALLLALVALSSSVTSKLACAQTLGDLLRSIQPGQAATPPASTTPDPAPPSAPAPAPAPVSPLPMLDTKPAFMSVLTNYTRITNAIVVTNYLVKTNVVLSTNYFNAQGQMLTPIQPGAAPVFGVAEAKPVAAQPTAPDPAVVRSNQVRAVKELLIQSLTVTSNTLSAPGSFASNAKYQIRNPESLTVLDSKKAQNLTTAMNTAAEQAIPSVLTAVATAIAKLAPPAPADILHGNRDAASAYLLSTEGQNLANQVLTAVEPAARGARVQQAYNNAMLRGGGLLGAVLGGGPSVDINAHISKGVLEAVFLSLSAQEDVLRTDPSARKSKILQDALGK